MAKTTLNRRSKVGGQIGPKPARKRITTEKSGGKSPANSSERKSIAELAAEQGVRLEGQLEKIIGAGAGLWSSDKEFDGFVQGIYDRRREGLGLGKP